VVKKVVQIAQCVVGSVFLAVVEGKLLVFQCCKAAKVKICRLTAF
jgi:hypothetical protein